MVVPTGIATDDSTKKFFGEIVESQRLASLYDFENREGVFPGVHRSYKFCLLTLGSFQEAEFLFFATQVGQLKDARRRFRLSAEDFRLINPNTLTCPVFRSERDAELTKKIYRHVPVLINDTKADSEGNPWGVSFLRMFDMSNDSGLFSTEGTPDRLPLYEAKMIHHFDHRWATYRTNDEGEPQAIDVTEEQKADPDFAVAPRYWVDAREVSLRTARLPAGLLKAIRDHNRPAIVLCIAHLLFGRWLLSKGISTPDKLLEELILHWRAFVHEFPFARELAPTQLGLCGDNPPSRRPTAMDFLPAEPAGNVKDTENECTAWYQADPKAVATYLEAMKGLNIEAPRGPSVACESDAILFAEQLLGTATPKWFMGWRDICRSTDERTVISSVVPRAGVGNNFPVMLISHEQARSKLPCLVANLNALVLDFVARHKVGGTHLNYFIYKQLPVLSPESYADADVDYIVPRVLELAYTASDLRPWAETLDCSGPPFPWDPDRRAQVRAELDAYYARLYGLTRDELRYILDPADVMGEDYPTETFRVLKNNEMQRYGEYRTRRLVLEAWDRLVAEATQAN